MNQSLHEMPLAKTTWETNGAIKYHQQWWVYVVSSFSNSTRMLCGNCFRTIKMLTEKKIYLSFMINNIEILMVLQADHINSTRRRDAAREKQPREKLKLLSQARNPSSACISDWGVATDKFDTSPMRWILKYSNWGDGIIY